MFTVGSVVNDDTGSDEQFVIIRIHLFDSTTPLYDMESLTDHFVHQHVPEECLSLAANQNLTATDAYDRSMRGI